MEAKDTVMTDKQISECEVPSYPNMPYDNYRSIARRQAEITWPIAFKAGQTSRTKEIVEWLGLHQQAKLKEWGL